MAFFLHIGIRFYGLYVFFLLPVAPYRYNDAASSTLAPSPEDLQQATSCVCALKIWCLMFLLIHPGSRNLLSQAKSVSHSSDAAWIQSSTAEQLKSTDTAEKALAVLQCKQSPL